VTMDGQLSYQAVKTANEAKSAEDQREQLLRKSVLVMIRDHLETEGYIQASDHLLTECGIGLDKYECCDNIDLVSCIREFQTYYKLKFNKPPKMTKKIHSDSKTSRAAPSPRRNTTKLSLPKIPKGIPKGTRPSSDEGQPTVETAARTKATPPTTKKTVGREARTVSRTKKTEDEANPKAKNLGFELMGSGISNEGSKQPNQTQPNRPQIIDYRKEIQNAIHGPTDAPYNYHEDKIPKPMSGMGSNYTGAMKELAEVISQDIYVKNPDVRWDDLIGLDDAKKVMQEAVVYPIKYPQLFRGILSPWKGLLLFGPPGTGKTMLAKAVATECETTFFNISASSIVSKWRGDSEKLVRVLFELARYHAPSTIFLDEIDSIMSTRGGSGSSGDHEGSRRMKTELLVQMDGLNKSDDLVFILAASNLPWELDPAMLRRLEKRIHINLPTCEARAKMFESNLPSCVIEGPIELAADLSYDILAEATEGYSGSDIRLVCKEAAMRPLRKVFVMLESNENNSSKTLNNITLDPVLNEDVLASIKNTKPSAHTLKGKYIAWQQEFESV